MNAYVLPPSSVQRVDVKDTIQLQEAYPDSNSSGVRAQQQKQAAGSAGDCVKGDRSNLINKSIQQQESATARPSPGDETTLAARAGPLPNAWHMLCNKKVWSNPDGRQHSDLPQQPLASNDEQQSMSSISSSSDVQRFSDLESNSTVEEEEAPTLTINRNQQKRNSKRLSRSSDNQNKRATSFTCNRKGTVPVGKHDGFGHKQDRDRVIKTDEIALFMRCKTRYSRPDFKPIPPAPGSWDEVKPERVIDWGQTADECSSYLSKYEQTHDITQATWRNVPWLHELESSASSASSTRTTTSSPNSSDNNKLTHQEEKTARQTASHTTNKEDNASEKKTDKRIRPPPLPPTLNTSGNSSSKGLTKQTPTAAKTFDHGVDFDITQQLPRSATESLHNPSSHRSLENSLNPQNIWRQNQHHSFDTQSSTYRRLSTGTDYNQRMYTPWTAPLLSSTSKQNPKDWMGKSASTASASRQDWAFGFMSWPPTTTKQQRGAAATAGSDSRSGWNSADSNPMQQWEDRFASILKVVDDDSSMSSMPPTPTESDVWAPPSLRPYSARDLDKRRSSSIETSHHRRWTLGGGSSNGGSYERDNVNNFVMASTQLLQNIVQNGSIGCRHCGSGTHSIARDCPFIASATPRDAWIQLIHAANSENIPFFFEALDTYSKCCPAETLQSIARNLLDVGCNLHLVAMDIPLTSTTMLVDLQGTSQRRYTVYAATCQVYCSGAAADAWQRAAACYPYGRKPGLPRSFEQNLQWLADAGFPRDLTDMGQCKACKQNGHWAKDCTALAQPQPPISSSSSSCLWQYPWLGGGGSASSRQLDGSSLDYSRNKFPPAGVANLTIAKRRSLTQSNSKEAVHRLYYSLNDYVLVDGI